MYDFIGDIHGHADKLREILEKMGYTEGESGYKHSSRKAFFLGDFIDRGPQIRETLEIVRRMIDSENALAVMGNHEYNAISFHYPEKSGGHLRKHLIKNIIQHFDTLKQFHNKQEEFEDYLDWFLSIPLYYEAENFRAVHACWDNNHINLLRSALKNDRLCEENLYHSADKNSVLYLPVDEILKGKELRLPDGVHFKDKEQNIRYKIRTKWWLKPENISYKDFSMEVLPDLPNTIIPGNQFLFQEAYNESEKPVFFGHYWLNLKHHPNLFQSNLCCLDYSVAKNGPIAAYRFDGEQKLDPEKRVMI